VNSAEIRETYLSFFEDRGHLRVPSASLIPASDDPSVLLTTAGMQPFQPYYLGREAPPGPRLTSSQRCFRTPDIEEVGSTARHLTCFEMLGNFAFGDYFKEEAIAFAWELSLGPFGFEPSQLWVTVFGGDDELGLGPDGEAIELWKAQGVPEERIVLLPRSENFWQAGDKGPCGPCSELYIDRGSAFGGSGDRPGDDTDRFIEYWNLVFTAYDLHEDGALTELPAKNIDTGLGLERMAVIQQDVESVFDTDLLRPLVDLAAELSGRPYGADDAVATRAMRIIADHTRGAVQLIADGVVPSNERRGYVLRRIMRRAIYQGRVLGLEPPYLGRFAERAIELLAPSNPALSTEHEAIMRWINDEEESFGRTLDRGSQLLDRLLSEAGAASTSWISAEDAFELHDTYGFPYDLTRELVAERGLGVDDEGFEALMDEQRERARSGGAGGGDGDRAAIVGFVGSAPESRFVGYEDLRAGTGVIAVAAVEGDEALVKLEESPFYPEGGGQVADSGSLGWDGGEAEVVDVYRVGSDQALRIRGAAPEQGTRVTATVGHFERHATMRNHTATHLLHAALRDLLGTHVRQAGSAVRPDKLRFDFTHGARLTPDELSAIGSRVNEWIKMSAPVRAIEMDRAEAERLGAMALFGEKYGDWVRVVEVEGVSRELCGGTHVANTGEIGLFEIVSEGSSASNVRRIEAITGPAAIDLFRERTDQLARAGAALGGQEDPVAAAELMAARLRELEAAAAERDAEAAGSRAAELSDSAEQIGGVSVVVGELGEVGDARALLSAAHEIKSRLGDAAIVLAGTSGEKVSLVGVFSAAAVERGLSAADVIRLAAAIVGGGGGGKPEVAQAGGRDVERIDEALQTARTAIENGLR
jgi:alanyl-tRNA synthetase